MFAKCTRLMPMTVNNCNRGRDGLGKSMISGGHLVDRWSSQSTKRRSRETFADRCLNSVVWDTEITERICKEHTKPSKEDVYKTVRAILDILNIKKAKAKEKKGSEEENGKVSIRLSPTEVSWIMEQVVSCLKLTDKELAAKAKDLKEEFIKVADKHRYPEMAAYGRFIANLHRIDPAISFSHATSTNVADGLFDEFTALDDLSGKTSHMNESSISASCMLSEMSANGTLYLANLAGNKELSRETLADIIESFVFAVPQGKQANMFSKPLPSYVSLELLETELSLADAFYRPALPTTDLPLDIASVAQLIHIRERKYEDFGIKALHTFEVCPLAVDYKGCGVKNPMKLADAISKTIAAMKELQ